MGLSSKLFVGVIVVAVLAMGGIGLVVVSQSYHQHPAITPKPGSYLRVTAHYLYQSEPVDIDYIITCRNEVTANAMTGSSVLPQGGPVLYGVKLSDGKVLILGSQGYCYSFGFSIGESTEDFTRGAWRYSITGFLPVTAIFDDPKHLTEGWVYVSDDAYDRANSPLKFLNAKVTRVSHDEAIEVASRQTPNVVNAFGNDGLMHSSRLSDLPKREDVPIGFVCYGWRRLELPEEARELVRAQWPADHPRYWEPSRKDDSYWLLPKKIYEVILAEARKHPQPGRQWGVVGADFTFWPPTDDRGAGLPRRGKLSGTYQNAQEVNSSGELQESPKRYVPGDYYPGIIRYLSPTERTQFNTTHWYAHEVDVRPEVKGLFHCGGPWKSYADREAHKPDFTLSEDQTYGIIPSTILRANPNNYPITLYRGQKVEGFGNFFEDDRYLMTHQPYRISAFDLWDQHYVGQ